LRCIPQVHGIVLDTIDWVKNIISVEINSSTDNPMVFKVNGSELDKEEEEKDQ
jgi:histidine ammonia-lyase